MTPAPRIAFAWPEMPQYGARLVRAALDALGPDACVVSTRSALPISGIEEILGRPVRWIEPGDAGATWASLGEAPPDVLVVGGWSTPAFNALRAEAHARGAKVVMMVDNPWKGTWRQRLGSAWFRVARRAGIDALWVPGSGGAEFARRLGFPPDRIETGLYGADPSLFRGDVPLDARPRRFVFVGQLIARKGLPVLAEALRLSDGACGHGIDVFGTGPLEESLRGVPGVRLRGFLPGDRIASELAASRFLVLPSAEDHWPLVVHEAACCGCGLVVSDGVGSRHELVTAANGWVHPRHDAASLAACLREAASADASRLEAIRTESLRRAAPYSPEAWARRLAGILERVGARPHGSKP